MEANGGAETHVEFYSALFSIVVGISKVLGEITIGKVGEVAGSCNRGGGYAFL